MDCNCQRLSPEFFNIQQRNKQLCRVIDKFEYLHSYKIFYFTQICIDNILTDKAADKVDSNTNAITTLAIEPLLLKSNYMFRFSLKTLTISKYSEHNFSQLY